MAKARVCGTFGSNPLRSVRPSHSVQTKLRYPLAIASSLLLLMPTGVPGAIWMISRTRSCDCADTGAPSVSSAAAMIATVCRVIGRSFPAAGEIPRAGGGLFNPERAQRAVAAGAALAAHGARQDSDAGIVAADPVAVFSPPSRVERGACDAHLYVRLCWESFSAGKEIVRGGVPVALGGALRSHIPAAVGPIGAPPSRSGSDADVLIPGPRSPQSRRPRMQSPVKYARRLAEAVVNAWQQRCTKQRGPVAGRGTRDALLSHSHRIIGRAAPSGDRFHPGRLFHARRLRIGRRNARHR